MLRGMYPWFYGHCLRVSSVNAQFPSPTSHVLHVGVKLTNIDSTWVIDAICFLLVYKAYMPRAQLNTAPNTAQELCESPGGCPGLLLPLIVWTVSVDTKQHWVWTLSWERALQDPVLLLFDAGTVGVLTGRVGHAHSRTTGGGGWLWLWLPPGHGSARHVDQGIF